MIRQQRSFCRICLAACGIVVDVDDATQQVVAVRGDADHPLSKGYVCPKGRALGELHHHGRLDGAWVRRDEVLQQTTVEDALDDLAARLATVLDRHGPGAVATFTGSGTFSDPMGGWAMGTLKRALGITQSYSTSTVDAVAKVLVANLVAGTSALFPHPDDAARLVLFVGSNPVVSHGQSTPIPNPIERIRATRAIGEVWVLDPRRTETAALADRHLAARAGTDWTVLAHLVREALRDADLAALAERADGVDELASIVEPFDAAHVAALTGLGPAELVDLAAAVRRAGRLAVVTGTGVTMARAANVTEWMAWALMIVTDSFDRPGGMWFNPGYNLRLDQRSRPIRATVLDQPGPPSRPDLISLNGEWPTALIPAEVEAGRLRALLVMGGNPALAAPDGERVAAAFRSLDVLGAFDIVPTATTDLATHAFGCADQLERADLGNLELFGGAVYAQFTEAVVAPSPDRPEMWRLVAKLARRLGVELLAPDDDLDTVPTDEVLVRTRKGLDLEALRAADGPLIAERAVYGWAHEKLPFGRWRLAPQPLVDQLGAMPAAPPLMVTPRRQMRRMNGLHYRDGDHPDAVMHPDDARRAGVADGDLVDVTSATGRVRLPVRVADGTALGTVSVPHGWGDVNVNVLTSADDLDPYTGMPVLSGTAVEVTRAPL